MGQIFLLVFSLLSEKPESASDIVLAAKFCSSPGYGARLTDYMNSVRDNPIL
jgi:hypothetical protein